MSKNLPPNRKGLDEKDLKHYYNELYKPLCRFVQKIVQDGYEMEDIVAESFVRAWKNLHKIENPVHLKRFLYRVASNLSISHLRKSNRDYLKEKEYLLTIAKDENYLDEETDEGDLFMAVSQYIDRLLPGDQQLLRMKYLENKTNEEIAALTGLTPESVKTKIYRALARVRKILPPDLLRFFLLLYFAIQVDNYHLIDSLFIEEIFLGQECYESRISS